MKGLNMRQRQALSYVVRKRYQKGPKKKKQRILDEFVINTGYNRNYASRILNSLEKPGRKKKHIIRKREYDLSVFYPLRKLWAAGDGICGKRLAPFLPELIRVLEKHREIQLEETVKQKLLTVSAATIDRILSATKRSYRLKHGRSTTKPGTLLRNQIPIRTFADWNENRPGFMEADLVAFCGEAAEGEYVNGLNMTDVCTGWVLLGATMGKGQYGVHKEVAEGKQRLPFPLLGFDSDNGTEFINGILKRYCDQNQITFTRIRPYRKNDNCFVEQKNYTTLRRFLGYARYDTKGQLTVIKEILKLVESYVNFFQPTMKLYDKQRIGARVKKKYDTAKTPYQRLLISGILNEEQKEKLKILYETINPMELKRRINKLQTKLRRTINYNLVEATNT